MQYSIPDILRKVIGFCCPWIGRRLKSLALLTEYTEPNEAKNYDLLSELIKARMELLYGESSRALRDTHAKSHAVVKAHLVIFDIDETVIKQELTERTTLSESQIQGMSIRKGLFAKPGRYPVWLRFANGQGSVNPDSESDTRSMSVKIIGVEGDRLTESHESKTQDIITQNGDVFFIKTIAYYNSFLGALFKSPLRVALWLVFHLYQWLTLIRIKKHAPKSLLTERYWSGSAYSLGRSADSDDTCPDTASATYPAVLKYAFTPVTADELHTEIPRQQLELSKNSIPENYYRDELIEQLARQDAKYCWNLGIQFQTNTEMSIDDVTIPWSEQQSPFFTVGRMTVEHQMIDFEKQYDFCENLTFAPWNGLKVHRPVGALNRLRRAIYPLVASYRVQKRGVTQKEPTGDETFD